MFFQLQYLNIHNSVNFTKCSMGGQSAFESVFGIVFEKNLNSILTSVKLWALLPCTNCKNHKTQCDHCHILQYYLIHLICVSHVFRFFFVPQREFSSIFNKLSYVLSFIHTFRSNLIIPRTCFLHYKVIWRTHHCVVVMDRATTKFTPPVKCKRY